ncbi:tol-pal system protein YbgF [Stappia sp. 28M-7]|uniref:tol-pal system protein YbgF n=1 Tax=Stappia sp. 28M-7 TaxID=2762596 RepID=UPI00163BB73B|nr:tol-pal system protein YbgF [Stappia sp. 28M-7]MBC2861065.1 tol-pal system protein YbgF [Stappia sp. 28M-7]
MAFRILSGVFALVMLLALPQGASAQLFGSRDDSDAAVRINQVEEQMRNLTGQIEQLNYQIRQLQEQLQRMQEDNEYRFQQLEQGGRKRSDAAPGQPAGQPSGQPGDLAGLQGSGESYGPASGTLGQLPADGSGDAEFGAEGGYSQDGSGAPGAGPLDLSALARGQAGSGGFAAGGGQGDLPPGVSGGQSQDSFGMASAPNSASPRASYDSAYSMIMAGDYAGAEAGFKDFLQQHPNDPLAANAQFWLGESLYARKQYRDAADAFLKSYTDYPDSSKVTDSLLKLGLSLKGIGQKDAACATFSELLTKYPGAPTSIRAEAQAQQQSGGCV